jgi:hypothetical protein
MTDVHEEYVERRRWRIWPIVLLVLVAMFGIAVLVAMIMNIHGSITWPAGEVKFGFWPTETTSVVASPATAPPSAQVATEIPLSPPPQPPPQVQQAEPPQTNSPPAPTPPAATPVEPNAPVE